MCGFEFERCGSGISGGIYGGAGRSAVERRRKRCKTERGDAAIGEIFWSGSGAGDRLRRSGLAFGSVEPWVLRCVACAGDFGERGRGGSAAAWKSALGGDGDGGSVGGVYRWGGEEWGESGRGGVGENEGVRK